MVVGLLMVEGVRRGNVRVVLKFGINHDARQKTLTDVLKASRITFYYLSSVALGTLYCQSI